MNPRDLLRSEIGQKILILLAPFVLRPNDFKPVRQQLETDKDDSSNFEDLVARSLYLTPVAPAIGAFFLSGAIAAFLKELRHHGFILKWLVHFASGELIFKIALCLTVFGYLYALARKVAEGLLKFIYGPLAPDWTLSYWFTNVGGIYLLMGIATWLVTLVFYLQTTWWINVLLFSAIALVCILFRLEWRYHRERDRAQLNVNFSRSWDGLTLGLSLGASVLILYKFGALLLPESLIGLLPQ